MPLFAMRFIGIGAIAFCVTKSANGLDIVMMGGGVTEIVIIFVPPLPLFPDVAAIRTR